MTRREIISKLGEIVSFAGLEFLTAMRSLSLMRLSAISMTDTGGKGLKDFLKNVIQILRNVPCGVMRPHLR